MAVHEEPADSQAATDEVSSALAALRALPDHDDTSASLVPVRTEVDEPSLRDPRRSDVDEWGRSEHMRELARRLYDPDLRASGSGSSGRASRRSPTDGGALLVANHAGAIPSRRPGDHARHRDRAEPARLRPGRPPLQGACRSSARCGPALGGVVAHPDNAYRLLREQKQLVLVFPEGSKGPAKHYTRALPAAPLRPGRLRRDRHAGRRARSSPSPWSAPRSRCRSSASPHRRQGARPPLLPDHRQHAAVRPARDRSPTSRPSSSCGCSTRALRRRRPTRSATRRAGSWTSPSTSASRSSTRSTTCSATAARSGSAERAADGSARPRHRARHVLGRPRRARPSRTTRPSRSSSGSTPASPTVELERTEYVRTDENYSILSRIVQATQVDTIVHTFLIIDSTQMRPRTMHEINVIGTMNLFAAASAAGQHRARRRGEVVELRLRLAPGGPGLVPRGDAAHATRPAHRVERSLEASRATCATSPRTTRT